MFVYLRITNLRITMEIKVLGTGCTKCQHVHKNVLDAVAELEIKADVTKVEDIMEIMQYGVAATPAVIIDGEIIAKGRIITKNEIKDYLTK